jgi:hypothetical protein
MREHTVYFVLSSSPCPDCAGTGIAMESRVEGIPSVNCPRCQGHRVVIRRVELLEALDALGVATVPAGMVHTTQPALPLEFHGHANGHANGHNGTHIMEPAPAPGPAGRLSAGMRSILEYLDSGYRVETIRATNGKHAARLTRRDMPPLPVSNATIQRMIRGGFITPAGELAPEGRRRLSAQ